MSPMSFWVKAPPLSVKMWETGRRGARTVKQHGHLGTTVKQESLQENTKILLTEQEVRWWKRRFSDIPTYLWTGTVNLAKAGAAW